VTIRTVPDHAQFVVQIVFTSLVSSVTKAEREAVVV
jgi:hypothetical protein